MSRNKHKGNLITLEMMEHNEIRQERDIIRDQTEVGKEEISDCLEEIRKMKAVEKIEEEAEVVRPKITETVLI